MNHKDSRYLYLPLASYLYSLIHSPTSSFYKPPNLRVKKKVLR